MSRKKRRRKRVQREASDFSRSRRLLDSRRINYLKEIVTEDLRTFHPDGKYRREKTIFGEEGRIVPKVTKRKRIPERVKHIVPNKMVVCRKRRRRREVLFKFNKIGKGKGSSRRRRRTWRSEVSC